MARKYADRERAMYEPVRLILINKFQNMGGGVHLEDTSTGAFSPEMREALEFVALHVLHVEKMSPDLTGYYTTSPGLVERIVVEIKARNLRIKDLYQVKMYADVLNASYCILVSSESLTREIREFIKNRVLLYRLTKHVIISRYLQDENDIIIEPMVFKELYYRTMPEPFKVE